MRVDQFRKFLATYYDEEVKEIGHGAQRTFATDGDIELDEQTALYVDIGFLRSFDQRLAEWTINNPFEAEEKIITASQSIRRVPKNVMTVRFTGLSEETPLADLPDGPKLVETEGEVKKLGKTTLEEHTIEAVCDCDTPFKATRGRGDQRHITCNKCRKKILYRKPDRVQRVRAFEFGDSAVGRVYREHTEEIEEGEYRVTGIADNNKVHFYTFTNLWVSSTNRAHQ